MYTVRNLNWVLLSYIQLVTWTYIKELFKFLRLDVHVNSQVLIIQNRATESVMFWKWWLFSNQCLIQIFTFINSIVSIMGIEMDVAQGGYKCPEPYGGKNTTINTISAKISKYLTSKQSISSLSINFLTGINWIYTIF